MTGYAERAATLTDQIAQIVWERLAAVAVVEGSDQLSYAELYAQAGSPATLLAVCGVRHGDRVAVMLANRLDAITAVTALLRLGQVLGPVGTRSRAVELDVCVDCAPIAMIHGSEFGVTVAAADATPTIRFDVSAGAWRDAVGVEGVPAGLDGVLEAAIVGRADTISGEAVVAFVSAGGGVTPSAVRAWCEAHLSDYKVPRDIVIETAPLPRNSNGKIEKVLLRECATALAAMAE